MPLADTDLAYVAGIIDGEGCIRLNGVRGRQAIRVHVTNTDPRLITRLKEWFGGYVWAESHSYIPNAKPRFIWEVSARKAGVFLKAVRPFLFLKAEQADIALAWQRTKTGRNKMPAALVTERTELAARLQVLNRKGVA